MTAVLKAHHGSSISALATHVHSPTSYLACDWIDPQSRRGSHTTVFLKLRNWLVKFTRHCTLFYERERRQSQKRIKAAAEMLSLHPLTYPVSTDYVIGCSHHFGCGTRLMVCPSWEQGFFGVGRTRMPFAVPHSICVV